jgi:hypothetical protein
MDNILYIRIKKDFAASLIEYLKKEDAIEIIEEEQPLIPDWQKDAVRKTVAQIQDCPGQLQPWDKIKQKYKRP